MLLNLFKEGKNMMQGFYKHFICFTSKFDCFNKIEAGMQNTIYTCPLISQCCTLPRENTHLGFIVIKYPQVAFNFISFPSNMNMGALASLAFLIVRICWATTDKTSRSILLNSSKQHQLPDCERPEKNFPSIL